MLNSLSSNDNNPDVSQDTSKKAENCSHSTSNIQGQKATGNMKKSFGAKGNILVVDDNPGNLNLLTKMLSQQGYKVRPAVNGKLALRSIQATPPDLILLDILMPEMDGYEVYQQLKAQQHSQNIPVIFISALNEVLDKVKAFSLGAVDYITKPFYVEEVLARIENQLRISRLSWQVLEQNAKLIEEIEERKTAQEQEQFYRQLFESSIDGIVVVDIEGRFIDCNASYREMLGYSLEELKSLHCGDITPAKWHEMEAKIIEQETIKQRYSHAYEKEYIRKDGTIFPVELTTYSYKNDSGQTDLMWAVVRDISERKQAEEALQLSESREREKSKELELALSKLKRTQTQLIQAEKMSSLGQMVAGVAHEINNPVTFISGNISPAKQYAQELLHLLERYQYYYSQPVTEIAELLEEIELDFVAEDFPKLLESMQDGAERINQIVMSLRSFSRFDEKGCKRVDIHSSIDNTLVILQHRLSAVGDTTGIEVIKDYGQLPLITCSISQLNQVFMNLLSNAIDALETQPAPRIITIRTEVGRGEDLSAEKVKELEEKYPPPPNSQLPTPSVVVHIADNGSGMTEKLQNKIFDPFFTTKPVGKGTGLGLSICYQIVVKKHHGQIRCISALGQGSEFIVEIPMETSDFPVNFDLFFDSPN